MPLPGPSLSRGTTALIALLGVRAIKAAVNGGDRRATEGEARRSPVLGGQKEKMPSDSASATQGFG